MAPVNPHAETYQGKTQFSGPVKAGTRWDGANSDYANLEVAANPIAVSKLANAGYAVCSQSCAITELGANITVMDIVLPSGSMILSMQAIVTTGFTYTLAIGANPLGPIFYPYSLYTDFSTVGVYNLVMYTTAVEYIKNVNNTPNVNAGDAVDIRADGSSSDGPGRAIITVNYTPGLNL